MIMFVDIAPVSSSNPVYQLFVEPEDHLNGVNREQYAFPIG